MFAKYIKEQRQKMAFSQEEIAKKLGISRPTYLQIENGDRELTISEAATLAEIFGISFYDFLEKKFVKEPRVIIEEEQKSQATDLEIRVTKKDLEEFKQVLLYVLEKVGGKPNVGETVLNKLLYFIDFDYYEKYEENLMGATYIKNHFGPTPVELKLIIDEMKKSQEVMEVKNQYFKHEQKKFLALKRADLTLLNGREIEHIDDVLARLADKSATEISEYSHHDVPWLTKENGEILSYESVFYRDEKYSVRAYADDL